MQFLSSNIEAFFYPFTVSFNKCGGSCNCNDNPNAHVFVPRKVKKKKHECKSI